MAERLKPCPFCGAMPEVLMHHLTIRCTGCGVTRGVSWAEYFDFWPDIEAEVVRRWNRRAGDEQPTGDLDGIEVMRGDGQTGD